MLAIEAYNDMKVDEAALMMTKALAFSKARPLTRSRRTLKRPEEKLGEWGARVKNAQHELLMLRDLEELLEERKELQKIRDSALSTAFDAFCDIGLVGRTGSKNFQRAKCRQQRNMAEAELVRIRTSEPFLKTFDYNVNVTVG